MARDLLFLLSPMFPDPKLGPGLYHCPECVGVEGILAAYPFLRSHLEVTHVAFPRPRAAIIALVGEAHQGCPLLVVDGEPAAPSPGLQRSETTGRWFASGQRAVAEYFAARHGTPRPH